MREIIFWTVIMGVLESKAAVAKRHVESYNQDVIRNTHYQKILELY